MKSLNCEAGCDFIEDGVATGDCISIGVSTGESLSIGEQCSSIDGTKGGLFRCCSKILLIILVRGVSEFDCSITGAICVSKDGNLETGGGD